MRATQGGKTTLISTGTGSGKTECFLYPIVGCCLTLRDEGVAPGIRAVIVHPMNALAENQLARLRGLLSGTGIPFGMYVGKTPDHESDIAGRFTTGRVVACRGACALDRIGGRASRPRRKCRGSARRGGAWRGVNSGGSDGTRTRDLRLDRLAGEGGWLTRVRPALRGRRCA